MFKGVRYSSPELSKDFSMVNERLKLLINTEDLRTIEAFRDDGTKYGILTAAGQWGKIPHSLKFRNAMNKFKRKRYFHYTEFDDPMEKFQSFLETNAINIKALRNLLAEVKSYRKKYSSENIKAKVNKKKEFIQNNHLELQNLVIEHKQQTNIQKKTKDEPDVQTFIIEQKIKEKNNGPIYEKTKEEPSPNNVIVLQKSNKYEPKIDANTDNDFKDLENSYFDELVEDARKKRAKKRRSINL